MYRKFFCSLAHVSNYSSTNTEIARCKKRRKRKKNVNRFSKMQTVDTSTFFSPFFSSCKERIGALERHHKISSLNAGPAVNDFQALAHFPLATEPAHARTNNGCPLPLPCSRTSNKATKKNKEPCRLRGLDLRTSPTVYRDPGEREQTKKPRHGPSCRGRANWVTYGETPLRASSSHRLPLACPTMPRRLEKRNR